MKLLLTVDHQFVRTPDGKVWVKTIYGYDFWTRYLLAFEKVRVACRLQEVETINETMLLSSGDSVEFFALPQYRGPVEFAMRYRDIKCTMKNITEGCECALLRIPSPIANLAVKQIKQSGIPWGVEIVNDPWDNFAPGTLKSILRPYIRRYFTKQVKRCALEANGVAYVTKEALQKRYPSTARIKGTGSGKFEGYYSSIILKKEFFYEARTYKKTQKKRIVHINSCISDYSKGHDVVIRTLKQIRKDGMDAEVVFVGDGPYRRVFEQMAEREGVGNFISFTGLLSGAEEVREQLLKADILIFPTLGEGLPRTVIEAMAVGLPCLSTPVNGIPELLPSECLIEQDNYLEFARKAEMILKNEQIYMKYSRWNLENAREYENDFLNEKRKAFYQKLKNTAVRQK